MFRKKSQEPMGFMQTWIEYNIHNCLTCVFRGPEKCAAWKRITESLEDHIPAEQRFRVP